MWSPGCERPHFAQKIVLVDLLDTYSGSSDRRAAVMRAVITLIHCISSQAAVGSCDELRSANGSTLLPIWPATTLGRAAHACWSV